MTAFKNEDGLRTLSVKIGRLALAIETDVFASAYASIVFGSPITGSKGQPVANAAPNVRGGTLRDSWTMTIADHVATIIPAVPYAASNEDGIARPSGGPYIQRAVIGGRWSVELTRTGMDKLVADSIRRLS